MTYLWIALGGAAGSVLRFALSGIFARWLGQAFLGTTMVNITGSFVIGFIAALGPIALWEQLLMIGVCGGYTTFSSFSLQTLQLIQEGRGSVALANAVASVVFCIVAVWLGNWCGAAIRR
jgi:CrcB protein